MPEPYHLFWNDIDKLKPTDFKTGVLFDLLDTLYRQRHGLTVTGNYSMRDLVDRERMHPGIIRRLDDMRQGYRGLRPMKPRDRVIWLRSPGRSFLSGWRVQAIPGEIVRVCRHRIRIRVRLAGSEKLVIVDPENVIGEEEAGEGMLRLNARAAQD